MVLSTEGNLPCIYPDWDAPSNVRALTTTRLGGVSKAPYAALNVGDHVGDGEQFVLENRQLLMRFIKVDNRANTINLEPIWLRQEHTDKIIGDAGIESKDYLKNAYDGSITSKKGVVCAAMTADCLPVFICDQAGQQVAMVHAGWRGLASGIVEKAMHLFESPLTQLNVHCGPAISQRHFEVGWEVKAQLGGSDHFYIASAENADKCYADLAGLLGERVERLGANYSSSKQCTFDQKDHFFSYRRDGVTGRMVSLIWMNP